MRLVKHRGHPPQRGRVRGTGRPISPKRHPPCPWHAEMAPCPPAQVAKAAQIFGVTLSNNNTSKKYISCLAGPVVVGAPPRIYLI
jgi:hypothetical protein